MKGSVSKANYDNYVFLLTPDVLGSSTNFSVSVTPISGDPDLYMSLTTVHPTDIDYQWDSANIGPELIVLDLIKDDQACSPLVNEDGICAYYISVFGYDDAIYSLNLQVGATSIQINKTFKHEKRVTAQQF